jgi:uncharacterized protein
MIPVEAWTNLTHREPMECRPECAACCIAPSISSPIPGMPAGKPAGVPCVQLLPDLRCALFGHPERPAVCVSLRPHESMCGRRREEAFAYLTFLEEQTAPLGLAGPVGVIPG